VDGAHRRRSLRPGRRFLPRRSGRRSQLRGPRVPSGPEPPHPPLGPRRPPRRSRVPRRRLLTCPRVFPAAYVPQAHALPLLRATRHALRVRRLPLLLATCHKLRACHHDQTSLPASQLLASAAAGRFPARPLRLQLSLPHGETTASGLFRAANAALTIGQTTGKAALDGFAALPLARAPAAKACRLRACPIGVARAPEGRCRELVPLTVSAASPMGDVPLGFQVAYSPRPSSRCPSRSSRKLRKPSDPMWCTRSTERARSGRSGEASPLRRTALTRSS